MSAVAAAVRDALGDRVLGVDPGFGPVTVDVVPAAWTPALSAAFDAGATYLDFLTAYDELEAGFAVVAHLSRPDASDHLLLRTTVPRDGVGLETATTVYPGAGWHERETHEMFGIAFAGAARLDRLLLAPGFEGAPLRKDFVLASRVARPWPGAKEPGESTPGRAGRRRTQPPGVPADWPRESGEGT